MTDDGNPYRFVAAEPLGGGDDSASAFRQPTKGRRLDAKDVRRLAISQRALAACAAVIGTYALLATLVPAPQPDEFLGYPAVLFYVVMISMMVGACIVALAYLVGLFFVFAVGRRTHRLLFAILFTLFAFSPPLALPIYLYLHFRANHVLKRHGVAVGWLGARFRSLPKPDARPIVENSPA